MSMDSTGSADQDGTTDRCLRRAVSTGAYSELVALTIPPGEETGEQTQDNSDQVVFIVEGRAEAVLNGQPQPATEHDAVFIPAGTAYGIKNSGVVDLKIFVVYSPPLDAAVAPPGRSPGTKNFYAIAQSIPLTDSDHSEPTPAPFPSSIKWTSWKSTELKNVLFATDFSAASEMALPYALSIARRFGSHLLVAHVFDSDTYGLMAGSVVEQALNGVKEGAVLKISELMKSVHSEGVPYDAIVEEGAIVETLLEIVRQKSIDLVVLGTHGRRGLNQWILGSVAEKVFRLAVCPILTVGPNTPPFRPEKAPVRHILYPMELSTDVPEAASYARSIAKAYGAELTFLNVIEQSRTSLDERAWINVAAEHWFEDRVASSLGLGTKLNFVQKFGDPATEILLCAKETGADLIVMNLGAAHPTVAGRFPAIAYRVVSEATCPVLTIRTRSNSEENFF